MNVPMLRQFLALNTAFPPGRVVHALHHLKRAGVMPNNGRGHAAAEVQPEHVAAALVAVAIADTVEGSAARVSAWLEMPELHSGPTTFGTRLAALCESFPNNVREVRICRDWPRATVIRGDGSAIEFGFATDEDARRAGYSLAPLHSEFVIPGGALDVIASGFRPTEGGWVFS